jgi:hypothetical protein
MARKHPEAVDVSMAPTLITKGTKRSAAAQPSRRPRPPLQHKAYADGFRDGKAASQEGAEKRGYKRGLKEGIDIGRSEAMQDMLRFIMEQSRDLRTDGNNPEILYARMQVGIDTLGLGNYALSQLQRCAIETVGELYLYDVRTMMTWSGFGRGTIANIQERLEANNLPKLRWKHKKPVST